MPASIILPGDTISLESADGSLAKTGPGIFKNPLTAPIPIKAGIESTKSLKSGEIKYIDTNNKRVSLTPQFLHDFSFTNFFQYTPSVRDNVIGIVQGKHAEGFRVLLQEFSPTIQLGQFAFANASKKNRVNLNTGSVVYGRILVADPNIEPEMECVDSATGQAGGYGELKGGHVFDVPLAYARALLYEGGPVLEAIGEIAPYEIAVGMNGKVWVSADDLKTTWKVAKCIQQGQKWAREDVSANVSKIFSS